MSIETKDSNFQISLDETEQGHLVIHRQGPAGQALVAALTPEQVVEMVLRIEPTQEEPRVPTELQAVLEEQGLEIIQERHVGFCRASLSRHAEYKDGRTSQILKAASETGKTWGEAVRRLVQELSGKLLVVDAYRTNRREIQLPEFSPEVE